MRKHQDFFDRAEILETIHRRLSSLKDGYRRNIAIIGNPLMGKTYILKRFLSSLNDEQIIPVYLEIGSQDLQDFISKFLATLLFNFLKKKQTDIKQDLDFLMETSKQYIPKTVDKIYQIRQLLEKGKRNDAFNEAFGLLEILNQETGKFILIIFDEFQHLQELSPRDIFKELGKKIMVQKKSMYIFVSSARYRAKKILSKDLSLLFGNFEVIDVGPFNLNISREFILDRTQGVNISGSIVDFLINFTGGCPFYLDLICSKASQLVKARGTDSILQTNIINVLEEFIFESYGQLNQRYSRFLSHLINTDAAGSEFVAILVCLANNCNKLKEMSLRLHRKRPTIQIRLNKLFELDIIDRNGDFYQINDRVFNFWLRFVYQVKLDALDYNLELQVKNFRIQIESLINDFISVSRKDTADRVIELFNLFRDDCVQLERRRFKLCNFREIKPLRLDCRDIKNGIAGLTQNSLWLAGIKEGRISENDVVDFAAECKKYRHKLQRKIIVAFRDIEINAYLLAKQMHIWTWDIENLNSLLDLYGRPRIVNTDR